MGMAGWALTCATMSCSSSRLSLRGTPRSERPLGCKAAKPPRSWAYHQSSNVRTATDWLEPSVPAAAEAEVIPQQREVATLSQEPQNGGQCFFGQAHLFPQVRRLGNHARNQLTKGFF